jgi:hypothetical protein
LPLQIARGAVDQTGTDLAAICESANAKRTSGGWAALSYSCFDNLLELDERERLLKMRKALLDLANSQDWLDGKETPPTQQQQQRQPRQKKPRSKATRSARRA